MASRGGTWWHLVAEQNGILRYSPTLTELVRKVALQESNKWTIISPNGIPYNAQHGCVVNHASFYQSNGCISTQARALVCQTRMWSKERSERMRRRRDLFYLAQIILSIKYYTRNFSKFILFSMGSEDALVAIWNCVILTTRLWQCWWMQEHGVESTCRGLGIRINCGISTSIE